MTTLANKETLENKTLLTDLYQLTMNAAYFDNGMADDIATFDLFIRKLPKDWGYFIANGIEDAIDYATNTHFSDEDIDYLREQGIFKEDYLQSLKTFTFEGSIAAVKEGTVVFPNEPILRITAKRSQAQFLETALLNIINFQTMIASKTSRIVEAAAPAGVVDYGLRRAQEEDAGMKGARAAYIAGAKATSNVKAGKKYNIPISGTHAHSFIMSFPTELDAFRAYVKTFPEQATLLIDTYDTLQGARHAAIVGNELARQGHTLGAVRLDSGDLATLAKDVRKILDAEGLPYVKIVASNDLNEYKIAELKMAGAPIDGYGVGTELITAKPTAALPGVYKLAEDSDGPKIKLSEDKITLPGKKQVHRITGVDGKYITDIITLETEHVQNAQPLLEEVVREGKRVTARRELNDIRAYAFSEVAKLPDELKRTVVNTYVVQHSKKLTALVQQLKEKYGG
ncbi:MAG: nicotinate phosphoribosyltransferase [archaeon]